MQKTSKDKDPWEGITIGKPKTSAKWEEVDINRVCFRSDGRAPLVKYYTLSDMEKMLLKKARKNKDEEYLDMFHLNHLEIFKEGFNAQLRGHGVTPKYRDEKPDEKVGDINNETAVCVSTDFYATPFFPLSVHQAATKAKKLKDTWSYAVFVERGYNTNMKQFFQGQSIMEQKTEVGHLKKLWLAVTGGERPSLTEKEVAKINWALFGQELAVHDSIPVSNIIAAVKVVERVENIGGGFDNGVTFRIEQLVENPQFGPKTLDKVTAKTYYDNTVSFLKDEIKNPKFTVTPNSQSGIVKTVTSCKDNLKAENTARKNSIDLDVLKSPGVSVTEAIHELKDAVCELTNNVIALQKTKTTDKNQGFWA